MSQDNITKSVEFLHKSVKLTKYKIVCFLKNYKLGSLIKYKWLKKGFANTVVHIMTSKGDYILKIVERNNPDRVRYEVDLLTFLKGLPTPQLVKTKKGQILINYDRTRKAFIYHYLSGNQLANFQPKMLGQVGSFLAKLHNQTIRFKSGIKRLEWYNINPRTFKKIIVVCKKVKQPQIKKQVKYLEKELLNFLLPRTLPTGAMHIDLKPENILVNKGKLSGVVDFDNSYQGPLVLDLANTMMWFCSKDGKFIEKQALEMYRSYRRTRKLSKIEKKYFFKAFNYAFLSHVLIDIYLLSLKRLPLTYIKWAIKNILRTQQNSPYTEESFNKIFN